MTEFETLNFTTDQSLFGIRFYADTARYFIGSPVSELNGYRVSLEEIWGREGLEITEDVRSVHGISQIIDRIESRLLKLVSRIDYRPNGLLHSGMQHLYAEQGMLSVRSLAEKLGYSERHVRRAFLQELGVGPKELSRIIRYQNILEELNDGKRKGFADTALRYGYSDQSHFIHTFRRFYGLTPQQVFKNDSRK